MKELQLVMILFPALNSNRLCRGLGNGVSRVNTFLIRQVMSLPQTLLKIRHYWDFLLEAVRVWTSAVKHSQTRSKAIFSSVFFKITLE